MAWDAASHPVLFGENIVPRDPLLGYLLRLGTPSMAYLWPFPFPFSQVIFLGFSSGSDWISTVQKHSTFIGVTETGSLLVSHQDYLAWKPSPQSENIRATEQRMVKQLFTQT